MKRFILQNKKALIGAITIILAVLMVSMFYNLYPALDVSLRYNTSFRLLVPLQSNPDLRQALESKPYCFFNGRLNELCFIDNNPLLSNDVKDYLKLEVRYINDLNFQKANDEAYRQLDLFWSAFGLYWFLWFLRLFIKSFYPFYCLLRELGFKADNAIPEALYFMVQPLVEKEYRGWRSIYRRFRNGQNGK